MDQGAGSVGGLMDAISGRIRDLQGRLAKGGLSPKEKQEIESLIDYWRARAAALSKDFGKPEQRS